MLNINYYRIQFYIQNHSLHQNAKLIDKISKKDKLKRENKNLLNRIQIELH